MKQAIGIFLVSVFLGYQVLPAIIFIDFKINQEYIASVLCIKKDIPKNSCNGNCHLKDTIEKSVPTEKPEQKAQTTYRELVQINSTQTLLLKTSNSKTSITLTYFQNSKPSPIYYDGVFHPPQNLLFN